MRGSHPFVLFHNPSPKKSLDEIFEAVNNFTDEVFEGDEKLYHNVSCFCPLLPQWHQGRFIKGVLFTHAADLLLTRMPWLKEYFHTFAYAMYSAFPRAELTDGLMIPYHNPQHEAWFKRKYPERAHKIIVGLDDSDFINEGIMRPSDEPKLIDVLCISRLDVSKNLPIFAQTLKTYRQMYPKSQLRVVLKVPNGVNLNCTGLSNQSRAEMRKISEILGFYPDYLYLASSAVRDMSKLISRARCVVMCSLAEGKNRSIHEAMCCDVPVITFADFNKFVRGPTPIFPEGGGKTAPAFTPESLAATIKEVLDHSDSFKPRQAVLKTSGRQVVLETLMRAMGSYYPDHLEGPLPNKWHTHAFIADAHKSVWGASLLEHLFGIKRHDGPAAHMLGLDRIVRALEGIRPHLARHGYHPATLGAPSTERASSFNRPEHG